MGIVSVYFYRNSMIYWLLLTTYPLWSLALIAYDVRLSLSWSNFISIYASSTYPLIGSTVEKYFPDAAYNVPDPISSLQVTIFSNYLSWLSSLAIRIGIYSASLPDGVINIPTWSSNPNYDLMSFLMFSNWSDSSNLPFTISS